MLVRPSVVERTTGAMSPWLQLVRCPVPGALVLVQIEPVLKRSTAVARAAIVHHIAHVWFLQRLGSAEGHVVRDIPSHSNRRSVRDIPCHSNRRSVRDILVHSNRHSVRLNLDPEKEQVKGISDNLPHSAGNT